MLLVVFAENPPTLQRYMATNQPTYPLEAPASSSVQKYNNTVLL